MQGRQSLSNEAIEQERRDTAYRWVILSILTLGQLVMSVGSYAWGPLAPFLREAFLISRTQVGSIVSALYFISVIVAIPSGLAVDKWGAKRMLILALLSMSIPFVALATVHSFSLFIVFASISGIGYGMINQISTKGIMLWFSSSQRATAMGIKQTGVTMGGAIGAVALPFIAEASNWRWAVFITGLSMFLMFLATVLGYRECPFPDRSGVKNPSMADRKGWIKDVRLLWSKFELKILCIVAMLLAASQTCISSFLILYLRESLQFSIPVAGTCLSVFMIAGTAGRILWGVVSDRLFHGDRNVPFILLGFAAAVSIVALLSVSETSSIWLVYATTALMGFTYMGWNAIFITLGAEMAGSRLAGSVTGLTLTLAWSGIILGPPMFGMMVDQWGYFSAWMTLGLCGMISAVLFLWLTIRKQPAT